MHRVSLLVLVTCISINTVIATCTSRQEEGFGERLTCYNASLTALNDAGPIVKGIMIFQSRIERIPDRTFLRYGKSLTFLRMANCSVAEISAYAFDGLTYLESLGLPYNNITLVREQWFANLMSLQQLDLSYNLIASIEPAVFEKLRGLRRLDLRGNRLTCLQPAHLAPMAGLEKLRIFDNPFTLRCRGKLTLWLRDLGIKYKTEQREEEQEDWLDNMLWLCAAEDGKIADSEVFMKECVVLNLFNQLRTSLTTAESYPLSIPQECVLARNELTKCVANDRRYNREVVTNGHVVRKLLRQLRESKSSV